MWFLLFGFWASPLGVRKRSAFPRGSRGSAVTRLECNDPSLTKRIVMLKYSHDWKNSYCLELRNPFGTGSDPPRLYIQRNETHAARSRGADEHGRDVSGHLERAIDVAGVDWLQHHSQHVPYSVRIDVRLSRTPSKRAPLSLTVLDDSRGCNASVVASRCPVL